jgi:uncharacterized protein (DUF433 family)
MNIQDIIVATPDILGGRPRISNTRVSVRSVAGWYRQGYHAEETAEQYEHLTLAQIYAALIYYHANKAEIEEDILAEQNAYDRLAEEHYRQQECA